MPESGGAGRRARNTAPRRVASGRRRREDGEDEGATSFRCGNQQIFIALVCFGMTGFMAVLVRLYWALGVPIGPALQGAWHLRGGPGGPGGAGAGPSGPGDAPPVAGPEGAWAGSDSHLDASFHASQQVEPVHTQPPPLVCRWEEHPGTYLGEFVEPQGRETNLIDAQRRCESSPGTCKGVTCFPDKDHCSLRKGIPYLRVSPSGEASYVRVCSESVAPPVAPASGGHVSAGAGATLQSPGGVASALAPSPAPSQAPSQAAPSLVPSLAPSSAATAALSAMRPKGSREPMPPGSAAVVVIAHNREDCLDRCLRALVTQSELDAFTLVVSLDDPGSYDKMERVARSHAPGIAIWHKTGAAPRSEAVSKISDHFRFALEQSFERHGFEFAIFLENDLEVSPDFLWYFRATAWLLQEDPSLFCVSAWNDNGFAGRVSDERALMRTDYFPGLGWMIRNDTWAQIRPLWPAWPSTGWDHWLRHGSGLRPRECIIPEVSRTHHFDTHGTNVQGGSDLHRMLESMVASRLPPRQLGDLSYLLRDSYESHWQAPFKGAELISASQLHGLERGKAYVLPYVREEYHSIARQLQLVPSQPRTAHRGVILTKHPMSGANLALIDRRQDVGLLPEQEKWRFNPQRYVGPADPGQSCDALCQRRGMRCEQRELEFVNTCESLKAAFRCESGCGHQVGQEIPCYVHDRSRDTAMQCLVTDDESPTCSASCPATTRLCVCVPR